MIVSWKHIEHGAFWISGALDWESVYEILEEKDVKYGS